MTPERFMQSMIGYHSGFEGSLCSMIMVQGSKHRVVNIGIGTKQVAVEPRGVTVAAYVESQSHKVSPVLVGPSCMILTVALGLADDIRAGKYYPGAER
jgi:hypothetical protein